MRLRVKPTKKQSRQDLMMRLIKEQKVQTQDGLKNLLRKHGFNVTQSSLSRDIAEVGLVKHGGTYALPPRSMSEGRLSIASIASAGPNLVVVKTLIGMAGPVGLTIDNHKIQNVMGTIAGDDTVFVATSVASHEPVKKEIKKLFKGE